MEGARLRALTTLLKLEEKDVFIKDLLGEAEEGLNSMDRALLSEIVYGVTKNKTYLDYIIKKASKIRIKKIHPAILSILRLSLYQMIFLDKIPISAIVNEGVNLAKKFGNKGSTSFVNGILRNISRNKEEFLEVDSKDVVEYLSIRYSHPKFLVEKLVEKYGREFTKSLLKENNKTPEFTIRVNRMLTTRENLEMLLTDSGYKVSRGNLSNYSLKIENPRGIMETEMFKDGLFYIQDEASIYAGELLAPKKGSLVLDICAAPGGKTTCLAEIMGNEGKIIARDKNLSKINIIKENAKRLKTDIIEFEVKDGEVFYKDDVNKYDYILLDAPCSGFGLLKKKPETKWNKTQTDIEELSKIQLNMLKIASKYLKLEGKLLYSTCTITDEENEEVVNAFLEENDNFTIEKFGDYSNCRLFPNTTATDGFTISILKRIS